AGVAAAAASATELAHPGTAQASSGGNFILGGFNTAGANTGLIPDIFNITALDSLFVVDGRAIGGVNGVVAFSHNATGVSGNDEANGIGVVGNSNTGAGVYGHSDNGDGVFGNGHVHGIVGNSDAGAGGAFSGGRVPLYLQPAVTAGPPAGGHAPGDIYIDSTSTLFVYTNLGTWVRLTGVTVGTPGGALNYLRAPIRLFDTRGGQPAPLPVSKGALSANTTTTIQVTGTIPVPAGATGVFGNLTVTNTSGPGDLILWPDGVIQPNSSNINYSAGQTVANAFNVGLGSNGKMDLFVHVNGTDVIIDIAGYVM
ncbi:MAG TPA: hypothetical protein VGR57_10585, partial [Ktedonobacterales bacterium]|nr:hypothetical protein [Ktedonobacterales bacterium]